MNAIRRLCGRPALAPRRRNPLVLHMTNSVSIEDGRFYRRCLMRFPDGTERMMRVNEDLLVAAGLLGGDQ